MSLRPQLTAGAVIVGERVTYPDEKSLFTWASQKPPVVTTDSLSGERQPR